MTISKITETLEHAGYHSIVEGFQSADAVAGQESPDTAFRAHRHNCLLVSGERRAGWWPDALNEDDSVAPPPAVLYTAAMRVLRLASSDNVIL